MLIATYSSYPLKETLQMMRDSTANLPGFVQWILSGPSQEMKSRSSLLEEIPTRTVLGHGGTQHSAIH